MGGFCRRLLGCTRFQRGPGGQLLRGRSGQRTGAKVPSPSGRQSGFPGEQAGLLCVEIKLGTGGSFMKLVSRRTILGATGAAAVCLLAARLASGQAGLAQKPQLAEEVFKNVQVLKGIPVNEFMGTMGVFSAALGMSCEDCHSASDRNWEQYALDNPRKRTARRMVLMMAEINRANFGGRQVVTCYTCHRASDRPTVTPDLSTLYTARLVETPDILTQAPGAPTADQLLDKYVQALGGPQRLASLTSLVAKGTSSGYGPEGEKRPV